MHSTNIRQIKAALWEQAFIGGARVYCHMGRVVAIRKNKGDLQAKVLGWGRWYPIESVIIERLFAAGHSQWPNRHLVGTSPLSHGENDPRPG